LTFSRETQNVVAVVLKIRLIIAHSKDYPGQSLEQ